MSRNRTEGQFIAENADLMERTNPREPPLLKLNRIFHAWVAAHNPRLYTMARAEFGVPHLPKDT